ncbi:HAD family phosphatase [Streptomyces sp. NPDC096323]|uniref:HAD family hydrolase n=1 Tax=Streptomyces sp. NPDC096323 TaxID=3155822 RepID=UPI00332C7503
MIPRALFLDFDGLICDTERAARRSWDETWARLGVRFPEELWERMEGRADGEQLALDALGAALGRPPEAGVRDTRALLKKRLSEREPLRPGVGRLLALARRGGLPLAVVSSSPAAWVEGHLARLGVRDHFAVVVTRETAERHKPAPDLYLAALARMGVAPFEAEALEDSAVGVQAARSAGLRCVAVPASGGAAERVTEADLVVADFEEYLRQAAWTDVDERQRENRWAG